MTSKPHPWVKRSRELRKSAPIGGQTAFCWKYMERLEAVVLLLQATNKHLVSERDDVFDNCTDANGNYSDDEYGEDDRREIAELDAMITANNRALRALAEGVEDDG